MLRHRFDNVVALMNTGTISLDFRLGVLGYALLRQAERSIDHILPFVSGKAGAESPQLSSNNWESLRAYYSGERGSRLKEYLANPVWSSVSAPDPDPFDRASLRQRVMQRGRG